MKLINRTDDIVNHRDLDCALNGKEIFMRIAFTSCMTAFSFPIQMVWDEIANADPDVLVLLGDSAYYDADGLGMSNVKSMSAFEFSIHAHKRIAKQLSVANFRSLIENPRLQTHAIWDDHDFMFNGACGAEIEGQPDLKPLVAPSRAVFNAYQAALSSHLAPGTFPSEPPTFDGSTSAPGYRSVKLANDVMLHLTDGRSFKSRQGKTAILGTAQIAAIEAACEAASPATVHLIASGIVYDARHGETWLDCETEYRWMQELAAKYNVLILSGDIHDNNLCTYALPSGRNLFEATSSGAAIATLVTVGTLQRNWGLLEIDDDVVGIRIFKTGTLQYHGSIARSSWQ